MHPRRSIVIACLAVSFLGVRAAEAASDPGAALFEQGLRDMDAGRYDEACPAIEQSYRVDPRPGTLFTLAECEAKRGRVSTAASRYDEYLALYVKLPKDKKAKQGDRAQVARKQKALLEPQIPELTLVLPKEAPSGVVVRCDGNPVETAALGTPLRVDPGEHVVTTWTPGEELSEVKAKLAVGQKLLLRLPLGNKSVATRSPVIIVQGEGSGAGADEPPSATRRVGLFVASGVGIAGIMVGGIMGSFALAQKSTVDTECPVGTPKDLTRHCSHVGYQAHRNLDTFALLSNIGFGVGAVAGVTAVVLIATEPQRGKKTLPKAEPSASVGVLSAGPGGALIGVKGAW